MKAFVAAIVLVAVAANFAYGDEPMAKKDADNVRFRSADKEIIVALVDNSAVRSLVAMLPLNLDFRDYAASEKTSDPPRQPAT